MEEMVRMGVVVHLKDKYVFKQGNKISKNPVYPIHLNEIKVVNYEFIGVI